VNDVDTPRASHLLTFHYRRHGGAFVVGASNGFNGSGIVERSIQRVRHPP
jgi:hypothetical protein